MQKPTKSFTEDQHKEYEKLKFIVHMHNDSAAKWAATLLEIKTKEYYLIDSPSWDKWIEKHCPWSKNTVRLALKEEESKQLVASTTGERFIRTRNTPHQTIRREESSPLITQPQQNKALDVVSKVTTDFTDYPIPEPLVALWERKQEIQDLMTGISRIKCLIEKGRNEEDKLFSKIDQSAIDKLESVHHLLLQAMPVHVCGICQGRLEVRKDGFCKACGSTGFMSKYEYETFVPEELRKVRQRALEKK